jgi:hypothetical protein
MVFIRHECYPSPLPDNALALELHYRLLAEVDIEAPHTWTPTSEPARNPRRETPRPATQQPGRDRPAGPRR